MVVAILIGLLIIFLILVMLKWVLNVHPNALMAITVILFIIGLILLFTKYRIL